MLFRIIIVQGVRNMYPLSRTDSRDTDSIQQRQKGELEYLVFPKLEETGVVEHLFTTRTGGVSNGIYSTMNLSFPEEMTWNVSERITDGLVKYWEQTRNIWWHRNRPIPRIFIW